MAGQDKSYRSDLRDKLGRLKLRHLTCALEVARSGSMRRTADALCITTSAVSKTLRELETELGVRLFDRSRTGMPLTDAGRHFASYASNALDTLQTGLSVAKEKGATGAAVLRVGAMHVVATTFLPEVVGSFLVHHPQATVEIATGLSTTLLSRLRDGLVDLVLGRTPAAGDMAQLAFEELYRDRYVFVVRPGHPLAKRSRIAAPRVAEFPLLMPPRRTEVWREIQDYLRRASVQPRRAQIEVMDLAFSRTYTLGSDAVWIASERGVASDLNSRTLRRLSLASPGPDASIGIITRQGELRMPQLQMVIDIVREASKRFDRCAAGVG